jgi:hypothetical protein
LPIAFVVKNGSKIRLIVVSSIPAPVSDTASMAYGPGVTSTWVRA